MLFFASQDFYDDDDNIGEDDDEDEIDVVSVLPAASTMYARVVALHNYSSLWCQPKRCIKASVKSSQPYGSNCSHMRSKAGVTAAAKRRPYVKRCLSLPSSPVMPKQSPNNNTNNRRALKKSSSVTSSDSEEGSNVCKRAVHNNLERNRRINMKHRFAALRFQVPEISSDARASKATILAKARDHIREMEEMYRRLRGVLDELMRKQEQLTRLSQMKRGCSS